MTYIDILSIFVIFIFLSTGVLHFYWSFGGQHMLDGAIPTLDEKPIISPSNFLTFCVGLVLIGFALLVYVLEFYDFSLVSYRDYFIYLSWFLSFMFGIRAIGDFRYIGFFKKLS